MMRVVVFFFFDVQQELESELFKKQLFLLSSIPQELIMLVLASTVVVEYFNLHTR